VAVALVAIIGFGFGAAFAFTFTTLKKNGLGGVRRGIIDTSYYWVTGAAAGSYL
jgi:hypothetical protein